VEKVVRAERLQDFVSGLFQHAAMPPEHADIAAECLVAANLRGVDTHGVFRVPTYLKRLRAGLTKARPDIGIERVAHSALHVDGDSGMGSVVGTRAMNAAIEVARETGVAIASVRDSTHFGMAAFYVLQALRHDLVAMAFTNASPALPPWGGTAPLFGTSPLAVAVPGGECGPFVLDMAMSVLARGNVYVAAQQGKPIPPGLALDSKGRPTTDPQALIDGGTMLAFGGVKGASLSMLMDILGGVLSGAAFAGAVGNPHMSFDRPQNVGHLFICFRPDLFMPLEAFKRRMDELVAVTKAQPKADGFAEILIPGEREERCKAARLKSGIPLSGEVLEALNREAERAGRAPLSAEPMQGADLT
jgi:LDH2 family malate/lactate/ureidoglycolate dehydrogenase